MSEIYWITVLDSLDCLFSALGPIGLTIGCISLIGYLIQLQITIEGQFDYDHGKRLLDTLKSIKNWSLSIGIVCAILSIFTPSSKEAMLIWGVGSTVDYIKTNDKIQQLPDKCIDALDAWVESLNKE